MTLSLTKICRKCNKLKQRSEFHSKSDKKNPNAVESVCKDCRNKTLFRYIKAESGYKHCYACGITKPLSEFNKLERAKSHHYSSCKVCYNKKNNHYVKQRYIKDPIFKLKRNIRSRLITALRGKRKLLNTQSLIGCDIDYLRDHLQASAMKNGYIDFDVDNYSSKDYHIDHIIPCSSFKLDCSYHQKLCFNWSNLQILSASENLIKADNL